MFYRLRAGWCKRSLLGSVLLVWPASSLAAAQDARTVLDGLGSQVTIEATNYGGAVVLLLAAFAGLILLGFIAFQIFKLISNRD